MNDEITVLSAYSVVFGEMGFDTIAYSRRPVRVGADLVGFEDRWITNTQEVPLVDFRHIKDHYRLSSDEFIRVIQRCMVNLIDDFRSELKIISWIEGYEVRAVVVLPGLNMKYYGTFGDATVYSDFKKRSVPALAIPRGYLHLLDKI